MRNPTRSHMVSAIVRVLPLGSLVTLAALAACSGSNPGSGSDGVGAPGSHQTDIGTPEGANPGGGSSPGGSSTPGTKTTVKAPPPNPTPSSVSWTGGAPKGSGPITGGTLLIMSDGLTAVASDPDRDLVSIVDLPSATVLAQLALPVGAEPGRLVQDGSGQVHAILRRGGGIADIDVSGRSLLGLRQACALPRGIAYNGANNTLLVTCMTGQIVTMDTDATKQAPISTVFATSSTGPVTDLRDIIVTADGMFITTFRNANVLTLKADGTVSGQLALNTRVDPSSAQLAAAGLTGGTPQSYVPEVGWRTILGPNGDIIVAHEGGTNRVINVSTSTDGATQTPVSTSCTSSEYGGETCTTTTGAPICTPPIMIGEISAISKGIAFDGPALPQGALPVDIVATPDGTSYIVALAGNPSGTVGSDGTALLNVMRVPAINVAAGAPAAAAQFDTDLCGTAFAGDGMTLPGVITAVGLDQLGQIVAQTRDPAALQYVTEAGTVSIPLSSTSVANEGFDLFHTNTGRGMTCAGCHAEGQDDGRTWLFTDGFDANGDPVAVQPRRTQTFRQGFLSTAPFHWDGEFAGLPQLMSDVFVHRMGATAPTTAEQSNLDLWLDSIPPRMHDAPSTALAASIAAGKTLFEDSTVGCTTCHSGANFTNNLNEDIGFGYPLQTPTLIDVQFRAPYLHDGSVSTLLARFSDPTALSGKHGTTAQLSSAQIGDLVAYLGSL